MSLRILEWKRKTQRKFPVESEFFVHLAAGGGFKIFAVVKMPADGGVPFAGLNVFCFRPELKQNALAVRVKYDYVRRPVDQRRVTVTA